MGLALGDAFGAAHEGGPLERLIWRFLGSTPDGFRRFTDDTQMSIDLAKSLINRGTVDQDDLATRFSHSYRWDRGYGPGAAKVLKRIRSGSAWQTATRSVYPGGSFGNGGAMRSPVIGLHFCHRPEELVSAARRSAEVTHGHPLGIEGAVLISGSTVAALDCSDGLSLFDRAARFASSTEYTSRLGMARKWLESGKPVRPSEVRSELGMGIVATESCVTALYLAARFLQEPLESLLAFAAQAGGDVDTVGAMAGALWGARNGFKKLPANLVRQVEDAQRISDLAASLFAGSIAVR